MNTIYSRIVVKLSIDRAKDGKWRDIESKLDIESLADYLAFRDTLPLNKAKLHKLCYEYGRVGYTISLDRWESDNQFNVNAPRDDIGYLKTDAFGIYLEYNHGTKKVDLDCYLYRARETTLEPNYPDWQAALDKWAGDCLSLIARDTEARAEKMRAESEEEKK